MAAIQEELHTALADRERFEAMALVDLNQDRLLFLNTGEKAVDGLKSALEAFLLRLVRDTESHEQFKQTEEIVFYDMDGRQLVSHYFENRGKCCVLVAVVSPQKTYKQIMKRIVKSLKPLV